VKVLAVKTKVNALTASCFLGGLFVLVLMPTAKAQTVVEDAKRFTEADCRWLHTQFLGECMASAKCSHLREAWDFSMSTQRGLTALETVITVRSMYAISSACERACVTKLKIAYSEWKQLICKPLTR
jgi:hypothetical protein